MKILSVKNLNKSFGGLQAITGIEFSLEEGLIHSLIGPNGAGKTTLFNMISGVIKPDSGMIYYYQMPINNMEPHQVARNGIARTFQNVKLFKQMSVLENIMVGCHIQSKSGFFSSLLKLPKTINEENDILRKSMEILEVFNLADVAHLDASSLPLGKQRIIEFARAYALGPKLMLLDEPAAGLTVQETEDISNTIKKLNKKGITMLIIEHDMSLIMNISHNVIVLDSGFKIAEGNPMEIQNNPDVIDAYLGDEYDFN